jgi:hypothetical protein
MNKEECKLVQIVQIMFKVSVRKVSLVELLCSPPQVLKPI